eukprot:gene19785-biopygen16644
MVQTLQVYREWTMICEKWRWVPRRTPLPGGAVTDEFCRDVDARVEEAFCLINECTEGFGEAQRRLYETRLAWGGLGMRPLHAVRHVAFVGAWMQCLSHVRRRHGRAIANFDDGWELGGAAVYSFHGEYRCALDGLGRELGVQQGAHHALGFSVRDAMISEHPKCQKLLSRSVLAARFARWLETLDPRARVRGVLGGSTAEGRRPLASEWLVSAPMGAMRVIPDQHYRLLIRGRLCMPVCERGEPCQVRKTETGGQTCGRELLPDADHAHACARSAIQARHTVLRNRCAAINREAGNAVSIETPPDVCRAVSLPSVQQLLLHRWRAEISCALAMANAEVYLAVLGATGPGRAGRRACCGRREDDLQLYSTHECDAFGTRSERVFSERVPNAFRTRSERVRNAFGTRPDPYAYGTRTDPYAYGTRSERVTFVC